MVYGLFTVLPPPFHKEGEIWGRLHGKVQLDGNLAKIFTNPSTKREKMVYNTRY
jgi:hypothetical protein